MASADYNNNVAMDQRDGNFGDAPAEELFDLQHYLRILRKNKWPIAFFTAVVTALAGYYAFNATPIYRSTATMLIESQKNNIVSVEELVGVDTENADYYQTQFELLKSRELAKRVVLKLNLINHPELSANTQISNLPASRAANSVNAGAVAEGVSANSTGGSVGDSTNGMFDGMMSQVNGLIASVTGNDQSIANESAANQAAIQPTTVQNTAQVADVMAAESMDPEVQMSLVVQSYIAKLSVDPIRKTKLVKISFESADPSFAAKVANTHGEEYILAYLDAKMELTTKASSWLSDRLGELKVKRDESEVRLLAYKEDNGLIDVGGSVARLKEQDLLLLTAELAQARSQLAEASDLRREVRSLGNNYDLLETLPAFQSDAIVRDLKIEIGRNQRALDELSNRYGARHPKIVDANSTLQSLQSNLERSIARVSGSIENDFKLLSQRVASIQGTINAGKQEIQAVGSKKFELDSLEREVTTNRELYDTFFSRMTEASSTKDIESANARISDFAVAPNTPIKPKKQLIIALAALGSLILSMLMAFLYEQMDDTITGTGDVEEKLGVKLLGILPLLKGGILGRKKALPLLPSEIEDKKGTFFESVNTARTAISLLEEEGPRKIIIVTSSVPGEGKSTASMNLAYSFSQIEKVLLIDCDLRRPSVAKALGFDKSAPGVSNLITGTVAARDCIVRNAIGELDVMCSGPIADQPLEILSSARFARLLEQLSAHYDRIIIDTAPTQAVSDALVLGKLADGVVYAVKSHSTPFELVKRGLTRLRQVGAPIAGVLITQVDIDKITSYGGDYYYQGYYDYYGYNSTSEKGADRLKISAEQLERIRKDDTDYDFDFTNNSSHDHREVKPLNGASSWQQPAAQANGYSDITYQEFDLTTEINTSERPASATLREKIKPSTTKRRFSDDLDIV